MSTMNPDALNVRQRRVLHWSQMKRNLAEWRHCARSRNELASLSDRCLQDIGLSRCTADFEASKPFWMI